MIYRKYKYFGMHINKDNIPKESKTQVRDAYFYDCSFDKDLRDILFIDCIFESCELVSYVPYSKNCFCLHYPHSLIPKHKRQKALFFHKTMNQRIYDRSHEQYI